MDRLATLSECRQQAAHCRTRADNLSECDAVDRGFGRSLLIRNGFSACSAQDRVVLFCVATGIDHGSVGIIDHAMQSMAIRGFIAHNRESGAYTLTDSGRATLTAILEGAP